MAQLHQQINSKTSSRILRTIALDREANQLLRIAVNPNGGLINGLSSPSWISQEGANSRFVLFIVALSSESSNEATSGRHGQGRRRPPRCETQPTCWKDRCSLGGKSEDHAKDIFSYMEINSSEITDSVITFAESSIMSHASHAGRYSPC